MTQAFVDDLKKDLPELPDAKHARFVKNYKLSAYDAGVLTREGKRRIFEAVAKGRDGDVAKPGNRKVAANWVINELFGRLNKEGLRISRVPVSADQLGAIIDLIGSGDLRQKRQGRI